MNPLLFALFQFRFPTVLAVDERIADIQNDLRADFPLYHTVKVEDVGREGEKFVHIHHHIGRRDGSITFAFNTQVLSVFVGDYPSSKQVFPFVERALNVLIQHVKPGTLHQIGLRFGNFMRFEGEAAEVLKEGYYTDKRLGEWKPQFALNRTVYDMGFNRLNVHTSIGVHSKPVLDDMVILPVKLINQDAVSLQHDGSARSIILDIDAFKINPIDGQVLTCQNAMEVVGKLRDCTKMAFTEITTDYARDTLWSV